MQSGVMQFKDMEPSVLQPGLPFFENGTGYAHRSIASNGTGIGID